MRDAWLVLLGLGIAFVVLRGVWRTRGEVHAWLGRDPFARRRAWRTAAYLGAAGLCLLTWRVADRIPPRFASGAHDVILVMDVSRSMAVADSPPSRLERARRVARRVLEEGSGMRVGLVLFAGEPYTALPLTLDRRAPGPFLDELDTDLISRRGSDLARALRMAREAFDPASERARAVLLLSDGEHAGDELPRAAQELSEEGVRVFAVGLGRLEGGDVPGDGMATLSDSAGRPVRSVRRDELVEQVVQQTGGRYWREWEERPSAAEIVTAIRAGTPGPVESSESGLLGWLLAAAALLVIEAWLALEPGRGVLAGAWTDRLRLRLRELPGSWGRRARAAAAVLLAAVLVSASDGDLIARGDALLAEGTPQSALWMYRRVAESSGGPDLHLRMGNAHFELGELDQAAAYYLAVLRASPAGGRDVRFAAQFNLGNALAGLERYAEAQEAFFAALRERPGDREAQFNYEWVQERVPPSQGGEGEPESDPDAQQSGDGREGQGSMDASEAERWLQGLEDRIGGSLRRQIERELEMRGTPAPPPGGQMW